MNDMRLYRWRDENGRLLYVGISNQPAWRTIAHLRTSEWTQWATRMDIDPRAFATREEACRVEAEAIRAETPLFNVVHADASRAAQIRYLVERGALPPDTVIPDEGELADLAAKLGKFRRARADLHDAIREGSELGMTTTEIARESGLTWHGVAKILNRHR